MGRVSPGAPIEFAATTGTDAIPCVLGGLTIMRCLGMARIPYVALAPTGDRRDDFAFHSRYCLAGQVTADPKDHPAKFLADLIALGKRLPRRAPLYYCVDQQERLISENRQELERYFQFLMPAAGDIGQMLDKSGLAAYCRRAGILVPETYAAEEVREKERAGYRWAFPLLFKPTSHVYWFGSKLIRKLGGLEYKGLVVENPEQFRSALRQLDEEQIPFLLQRFIPGGDEHIHSYHAFLDEESRPLAFFAGRKLRTFPPVTGESTYLELERNEALCRLGLEYVQRLRLVGPVKLDFKFHAGDGRYYLLEINARYNLWHYLGAHAGINLPALAYRYFTGDLGATHVETLAYRTDIRWLRGRYDWQAFLAYRQRGELKLGAYLRSLMAPKVYSKFAWHDPVPTLYAATSFLRKRLPFLGDGPSAK